MAKDQKIIPLRRVRWLLLAFLVLVVGTLLGLYLFGRAGRQGIPRLAPQEASEVQAGEGVVTIGEGFEFTRYEEGREAFSIRADRTLENREEMVFLEGVRIALQEESGRQWELAADRARYQRVSQETHLEGNVELAGGDGLVLLAEGLDLGNQGRLVTSSGPVELRYGDAYQGRGDRLRIHFPSELYLLAGGAVLESIPGATPTPLRITADRFFLDRPRQVVQADGGVRMTRGGDFLNARIVQLHLSPDLSLVRFIRAREDVTGRMIEAPAASGGSGPARPLVTEVESKGVVAVFKPDGEGLEELQIEGSPADRAILVHAAEDGSRYRAEAGYMTDRVDDDGARLIRFFGGVDMTEESTVEGGEPRRLTGDRGRAEAGADGALRKVWIQGGVSYRDEKVEATGRRMSYDVAAGTGDFYAADEGQPVRDARVRVVSDRGELFAPEVHYTRESNILRAAGGVEARLEDGGTLEGGPFRGGGGRGPVRVDAREAFFRDEPRSFLFRGDVRAWQGESLVLAEWLRGDEEVHKLTAGGGVRTVIVPEPETSEAARAESPTEVTAQEMTYLEEQGLLIYERDVVSEQDRRRLSCDRLQVTLAESGETEELVCTGDVRLVDAATGNDARADKAVYLPGERRIELTGTPAVLEKSDGAVVKAPRLEYDVDEGRMQAGEAETAEAPSAASLPAAGDAGVAGGGGA